MTLALFLQALTYGCDFEQESRLTEAVYLAPHFGQPIARNHPGVQVAEPALSSVGLTVEMLELAKPHHIAILARCPSMRV